MSFPKLNDFIGKSVQKIQYKRVSLIHSLRNSLARNTITQSSHQKPSNPYQSQVPRQKQNKSLNPITTTFKYDQKIQNNLQFSNDDLYKLLQHLFNKKQHDSSDRNFIRILLLKYFPEDMICAGGKDFVTHIKFQKMSKNDVVNFGSQSYIYDKLRNDDQKSTFKHEKLFYLLLRGKVTVKTQLHEFQKCSGQYFGQLEILGQEDLVSIKAKANTILLTLKQSIFMAHLSHYFTQNYSQLEKKINCFGPILNLVPYYQQLQILNLLYQKDYKTGEKIIQKTQPVTEFIFMNNTDISFSQDRILSEFRTIGLSQYVTMQNPQAQQTLYCMENKTVLAIKTDDLSKFLQKSTIYTFISSKYNNLSSLSTSKLATSIDDKTLVSQNSCKLQTFVNIKKVKFLGNKGRVLTQPNSSLPSSTPQSKKLIQKYPQYTASFVFIKQNSSEVSKNRKNPKFRHLPLQSTKHKQLKEYLLKTKNSFRKKRWLDELEGKNQNSIIYNPQKIEKMYSTPKNYNRNLSFADS